MVTVFGVAFPSSPKWISGLATAEQLASVTVLVFLLMSATRLCSNKGFPWYSVPTAYGVTIVGFKIGIANGWFKNTGANLWLASALPTFAMILALSSGVYIWNKIKPRRRTKRLPRVQDK